MDVQPYDDKIFYDNLGMRLWERRHQYFDQFINSQNILDIGCNDGKFIMRQARSTDLRLIAGMDIDDEALNQAKQNIQTDPLQDCVKPYRKHQCQVQLFKGDALKKHSVLKQMNFQLVTLIEVIEHLQIEKLDSLCENVFGYLNSSQIIITTPNADFNIYFKEQDNNFKFRHHDHKFEFTQQQFREWCSQIGKQYNYSVRFDGVGKHRNGSLEFGYASQIAIFNRISSPNHLLDTQNEEENQLEQIMDYYCPFDKRSEFEKLAECIIHNYSRYSVLNQSDITDKEYDYLEIINNNQILIRIDQLNIQNGCEELIKASTRFGYLPKDHSYLILSL